MAQARAGARRFAILGAFAVLLLAITACNGDQSSTTGATDTRSEAIPGLLPEDEVVLVRAEPEPDNESFTWTHGFRVGTLPVMSVGQPQPAFWEAAGREPEPNFVCSGGGGGYGCGSLGGERPEVNGVSFGGLGVRAWSWIGVPAEAAAVQFTDQTGVTSWQRPLDGVVMFPHRGPHGADGGCACRFDALSASGEVLVAVDVGTAQYLSVP